MKNSSYEKKAVSVIIFLLAFSFYSTFYTINYFFDYPFLQIGDAWFDRLFDDTYQILKSAECYQNTGRMIYESNSCAYFVYGTFLLDLLGFFNIFSNSTLFLGIFFIFLNITIFTIFTTIIHIRKGWKSSFLSIIISISPPFHYLLERGNFDTLIIFLLLLSSIYFYYKKYIIVLFLLSLATLFKFYTLPILIIFIFLLIYNRIKYLIFYVSVSAFIIIFTIRDAIQVREFLVTGTGGYGGTFGVKSLLLYAKHYSSVFNKNIWEYIYIILIILWIIYMIYKYRSPMFRRYYDLTVSSSICYIFGAQFIFIFFTSINNDYRLSLLGIYLMASIVNPISSNKIQFYTMVLGILSMWLSYPSWAFQVLGDISLLVVILLIIHQLYNDSNIITQSVPNMGGQQSKKF